MRAAKLNRVMLNGFSDKKYFEPKVGDVENI
jgi:hypothetical protein